MIELSLVMAIMVILAGLSLPTYQHQLRQQHRLAAVVRLHQLAISALTNELVLPLPTLKGYQLSLIGDDAHWQLEAQPTGGQRQDHCGRLSLNELGQHSPQNPDCWQ